MKYKYVQIVLIPPIPKTLHILSHTNAHKYTHTSTQEYHRLFAKTPMFSFYFESAISDLRFWRSLNTCDFMIALRLGILGIVSTRVP